jgi:hypothetical protein
VSAPEPCIHDLAPGTCADCRPRSRRRHQPVTPKRSWDAQYHGQCPACDEAIRPGDPIAPDENGIWVHAECA